MTASKVEQMFQGVTFGNRQTKRFTSGALRQTNHAEVE